jgi:pimeloyl-ACP methyl ester carboxylesterase
MKKNYLWTKSKARLHFIQTNSDGHYNWLFFPGGPGLGSESLNGLAEILHLPGTIWFGDLPGDGANLTEDDTEYFSHWPQALMELTSALPNVILVAHSSGGMFALATPELEKIITGLVLMDSAPDASWQHHFAQYVKENPIPDAENLQALYDTHPSNERLKNLTIACTPYFSTKNGRNKIISLLESLPFNYKTHQWAANNFDQTYHRKWIPEKLPTLIFAGDQDHITPLKFFTDLKDFQRDNILIRTIENASHFPWIDNPEQVKEVFETYYQKILS